MSLPGRASRDASAESIMTLRFPRRSSRLLATTAAAGLIAVALAGCKTTGSSGFFGGSQASADSTASIPPSQRSEAEWRREADVWGARYRENPGDSSAALAYAQALRALGQRSQASSVLEQASLRAPNDKVLLGAYGRALADAGQLSQALNVLSRAHSPDQPDWRILSAQGAVLDQMGRHQDAQHYYASALKIVPDEPSVLSNLGLSYALAKDLAKAEATLRNALSRPNPDPRVRQNLALVVGLQGRFGEAETIARSDLPADEAAANVAYLKRMLAQQDDWKKIAKPPTAAKAAARKSTAQLHEAVDE
jgi:Flp pilus assembly protein TadD